MHEEVVAGKGDLGQGNEIILPTISNGAKCQGRRKAYNLRQKHRLLPLPLYLLYYNEKPSISCTAMASNEN